MKITFLVYDERGAPFNAHVMDDRTEAFARTAAGVRWATLPDRRSILRALPLDPAAPWTNGDPAPLRPIDPAALN